MMDTQSPRFESLGALLAWCERAPDGTRVDAQALGAILALLDGERGPGASTEPLPAPDPWTWRERLWTVPAETRMGVAEVAEALGRPRSWVYARTSAKAESRLPHRKLDGALTFTAGEVRAWVRAQEVEVVGGPMESIPREGGVLALTGTTRRGRHP